MPKISHEQLHEAADDTALNDSLDLVVASVAQVGDGPACVDEDLVIQGEHKLGEDSERGNDLHQREKPFSSAHGLAYSLA